MSRQLIFEQKALLSSIRKLFGTDNSCAANTPIRLQQTGMPRNFPKFRYRAGSRGFRADDLKFFLDKSGDPLKFRIQPGISIHLKQKLKDKIEVHGGVVIPKVPLKGIVVVDNKSTTGREMVKSWKWKERPDRHFVDSGFIMKCAEEKQMLPLLDFSLSLDSIQTRLGKRSKAQRTLSEEAKDKLILYLATKLPVKMRNMLSSNKIYKDLAKKSSIYPWVKKYTWQTFREYYCKNKGYIDKLIEYVSVGSPNGLKPTRTSFINEDRIHPTPTQRSGQGSIAMVLKDSLSIEIGAGGESKHKKRKFGEDRANIKRAPKRLKTVDEMLRQPLPRFEVRKAKVPSKKSNFHFVPQNVRAGQLSDGNYPDDSLQEIEVGRSINQHLHMRDRDIWFDGAFRGTHTKEPEQSPDPRGELAAMTAKLDLDDLCCAVALDSTLLKDDDDTEDEDYVARLLGLTDQVSKETENSGDKLLDAEHAVLLKPSDSSGPAGNNVTQDTHRNSAIEALARDSQFLVEEVCLKLAAFSGNMGRAREFFTCCRSIIDVLFADFLKNDDALNLSTAALRSVTAYPGKLKNHDEIDMSSESFPARHTRARAVARANKWKTGIEK